MITSRTKIRAIDTDIVVFRKIAQVMDYLHDVDFICCDYQANTGIQGFLSEDAIRFGFMDRSGLNRVFNAGFFGSKKKALSWQGLTKFLREVSLSMAYFDFSTGCCDMPVFNSLVASRIAPIRPSIMSEGAITSAPASAWERACCTSTSVVMSFST